MQVGYCSYCQRWLGADQSESRLEFEQSHSEELHYLIWCAENVGSLIAAPEEIFDGWCTRASRVILECSLRLTGENLSAFGRLLSTRSENIALWIKGKYPPRLSHILKMSYLAGVPLAQFLSGKAFEEHKSHTYKSYIELLEGRPKGVKPSEAEKLFAIELALKEEPPPHPPQVIKLLGYKSEKAFYAKYRKLSRQLWERYSPLNGKKRRRDEYRKNINDSEIVLVALQAELAKENPSSLEEIAKRLGYKRGTSLRLKFPEICEVIKQKRIEYRKRFLSNIQRELKEVLSENPPPKVKEVEKRFRSTYGVTILDYFPDIYRQISARHLSYSKVRDEAVRTALKEMLEENPPQGVRQAAKRIGYTEGTLYTKYRELMLALSARYRQYKSESGRGKRRTS
jgi:hypothetical protein